MKRKPLLFCYSIAILLTILFLSCRSQTQGLIEDGATLTLVSQDFEFTEGPAADKEGNVFFTDQPNDQILKWDASSNEVSVYMSPSGRSNGLYFDHKGNLLSCADENTQLWRISPDKEVAVLVDKFNGKKFGGPNDLWVDPEGGIYFTDPYYQRSWWDYTEPEIKERRVYYFVPNTGELKIATEGGYAQPNGIIGSSDGKTLYLADNGHKQTFSFIINDDGSLSNKKLFADMGSDGMTLDKNGNVYLTGDGVTVFNKAGEKILHIPVPEKWTANITFGGKRQNKLFITAMKSVYTLKMNVKGVR